MGKYDQRKDAGRVGRLSPPPSAGREGGPARSRQVADQLDALGKELAGERELLDQLYVVLEPVLSPSPPQNGALLGPSEQQYSPLAARLADSWRTVAAHRAMVQDILSRLEV